MFDNDGAWLVVDTATIDRPTASYPAQDGARRGVGLVRVIGEIDLGTGAAFEDGLERVLARDPLGIVLDCSALAFCGAGGLATLMRAAARGAEHGTDLAVVGLSPRLRRLCARFWPGPQPTSYASVTDAVHALDVVPRMTSFPAHPA